MTADDFGLSLPVNDAVCKAHESGILTSTSLMVTGEAAEDAIAKAKALPDLKVGLHLVLTHGTSCLTHNDIPALVNEQNQFSENQVSSGIKMFFDNKTKRQLKKEIRAQFEAFKATGLALDHVNTHKHMHLHPTIAELIINIGQDYGLKAMRLPHEPPLQTLLYTFKQKWQQYQSYWFLKPWVSQLRGNLSTAELSYNQRILGLYNSGHMDVDTVVRMLAHVEDGVTELYCHPATENSQSADAAAKDYDYKGELKMLTHPRVKRAIEKFDLQLTSFSNL